MIECLICRICYGWSHFLRHIFEVHQVPIYRERPSARLEEEARDFNRKRNDHRKMEGFTDG